MLFFILTDSEYHQVQPTGYVCRINQKLIQFRRKNVPYKIHVVQHILTITLCLKSKGWILINELQVKSGKLQSCTSKIPIYRKSK